MQATDVIIAGYVALSIISPGYVHAQTRHIVLTHWLVSHKEDEGEPPRFASCLLALASLTYPPNVWFSENCV